MAGLLEQFKHDLMKQRLLKRGGRMVVAVSGGVDSMVLLSMLHALAPEFGWKLSVAHFNHRLRGRSSDADERLVRQAARRLNLPCDVGRADVRRAASALGESVEMAARRLRHEFLARCARTRRASVVALAHHADDQVELFLLRLLRGSGGEGLGGMKLKGASPADPRVTLVRPLLERTRSEILNFASVEGVRFREDASNRSVEFDRNWVRGELLPRLVKRHPSVSKAIRRTMAIAGAEADFVSAAAAAWLKGQGGASEDSFAALHVALQRRIVQLQVRAQGIEADYQLIEALRTRTESAVTAGPGIFLSREAGGRVRRQRPNTATFTRAEQQVELSTAAARKSGQHGRTVNFGGLQLEWRLLRRTRAGLPAPRAGRERFDADVVGARLLLRHWRPGDRFQPIGLSAATKLQDWFTNRKVPAARRRERVLAETERGTLFWVEGERIGEVAKVTSATQRVLELRWKRR